MSLSGEVLDALLAAGATADMIVAAVKADAAQTERKLTERRAKDATRQQKSRANRKAKASAPSRGVTVTDCDPSPNDIYSNPQPETLDTSSEVSPLIEIELSGEPPLSPEEILEAWNDTAGQTGLPKAKMTPGRRKKAASLARQHGIADFTEAINAIKRSPFLRGENGRSWRADFDFFLQPASFTRMIEGSYDRTAN